MLNTRNPTDVMFILRTAQQLLVDEAELLRRLAVNRADYGDWGTVRPTQRYRQMLNTAAELGALADAIATETESPPC